MTSAAANLASQFFPIALGIVFFIFIKSLAFAKDRVLLCFDERKKPEAANSILEKGRENQQESIFIDEARNALIENGVRCGSFSKKELREAAYAKLGLISAEDLGGAVLRSKANASGALKVFSPEKAKLASFLLNYNRDSGIALAYLAANRLSLVEA